LSGSLPTELGLLQNLRELWLGEFYVFVIEEIQYIDFLFADINVNILCAVFALDISNLSGMIPSELGLLASLDKLILGKFTVLLQ